MINAPIRDAEKLIELLEDCRGSKFSSTTKVIISCFLGSIDNPFDAEKIVEDLCKREALPKNIPGALRKAYDDLLQRGKSAGISAKAAGWRSGDDFRDHRDAPCEACGGPAAVSSTRSDYVGKYWVFWRCRVDGCRKTYSALVECTREPTETKKDIAPAYYDRY